MSYGIIYKATGPSGKVYIGGTRSSLNCRKGQHRYRTVQKKRLTPFHRALIEEGFNNFQWELIDSAKNREELAKKEKLWICFYDSISLEKGYNRTVGDGQFSSGYKNPNFGKHLKHPMFGKHHTLETRWKMKKAKKRNKSLANP
ncbi:MAG: GIY-YIG nuclease family protein [Treponema sp.]|jgi:group I intron endonuclease|nr:GIY-YIG nuclease family protein [Treponema sp.]